MKTYLIPLLVAGALLPATAFAGPRSSANYRVTTDILDAGGGRATSGSTVIDGSLGGIGGIAAASVPLTTAKHGYIGQLFDVRSLVLNANPTNLNENATRQLEAFVVNDDATTQSVAAPLVLWSVQSGPITAISAGGIATAGIVYEDTSARVRGVFGATTAQLGLRVINVNTDDFGSYAGDGLDDAWQVQFFGIGNANACPTCDPDSDNQNNRFEYVVGTIPTDATSHFDLHVALVPDQPMFKDILFSPRFPTRTYTVEYTLNPALTPFGPLLGSGLTDVGVVRTVRDNNATDEHRFYRVSISFP